MSLKPNCDVAGSHYREKQRVLRRMKKELSTKIQRLKAKVAELKRKAEKLKAKIKELRRKEQKLKTKVEELTRTAEEKARADTRELRAGGSSKSLNKHEVIIYLVILLVIILKLIT